MSNDTQIVALPDWEHPLVQAAYKILCSDDKPPEGEHWEGFVARRITAAAIALQAEQKDRPETNAENRWRKAANEWARSTGVVLLKDQKPLEIIRSLIEGDRSARPLSEPPKAPEPVGETQDVLIEGVAYTVPMPVAAEMLRLHLKAIDDTERLNWIETAATRRKVEIARSILGAGYEIGEWPSMRVTVKSGTLREAIDAARSTKGTT